MEVTLRKAHAIEKLLLETARATSLETTVTVSVYETAPVGDVLKAAQDKLTTKLKEVVALTDAAHEVRDQIGAANDSSGLNSLLRRKAKIDALDRVLVGVGKLATAPSVELADRQLKATAERALNSAERYGRSESLALGIVNEDIASDITSRLNNTRRAKVDIADKLLAINTNTRITLSAATVALIEKYELV